jgi:hypothetical protein
MGNFIEDCISGKATVDDFGDYLDKWHTTAEAPSFKEFFGITFSEFREVIKNHTSLKKIVQKYIERAKALERIFCCDNCGNISKGFDYGDELACPKCFCEGCLSDIDDVIAMTLRAKRGY